MSYQVICWSTPPFWGSTQEMHRWDNLHKKKDPHAIIEQPQQQKEIKEYHNKISLYVGINKKSKDENKCRGTIPCLCGDINRYEHHMK